MTPNYIRIKDNFKVKNDHNPVSGHEKNQTEFIRVRYTFFYQTSFFSIKRSQKIPVPFDH